MAIDALYIPAFSINTLITDKATGLPLSGGVATFYDDAQPGTPQPVFQITGTSPDYTYTQLPNPMILSSIGSFVDAVGDPVVPYFYTANDARYYITVLSSEGVTQFTRQAVPYIPFDGTDGATVSDSSNQIANPQFVEVLFEGEGPTTYSVTGSDTVTAVAPDWDLVTTGTGSLTVTREPALGVGVPSNPPYALKIATTGITGTYQLRQRMDHSPRLFAGNYVGAYLLASVTSASSATVTMTYHPSTGTDVTLLTQSVASGAGFTAISNTKLIGDDNTDSSVTGYIDIIITLPVDSTISITSAQMARVDTITDSLSFDQESTPRQIDHLFHYYKPELEYKPIPSYLVGWDFPLNPVQFLGTTIASTAFNIGANKSQYVWDQTIAFQTVDQGMRVTRQATGAIQLAAALDTQIAIIQYLPQTDARELLLGDMAVNVLGFASAGTAVNITVSLWYTNSATLPDVGPGSNNSIVASLDANGYPTAESATATWIEVPRGDQANAQATLGNTLSSYAFNQWTTSGAGMNTATFFAIVVGTSEIPADQTIVFQSISLVKGDIPTIPAPLTFNETLFRCQYYYQKSFAPGVIPANNAGNANASMGVQVIAGANAQPAAFVRYPTPLRTLATPVLYNPSAGTAGQIYNASAIKNWSSSSGAGNPGVNGFIATGVGAAGSLVGQRAYVHWAVDARLGII
jgi:hypothetical protein